MHPAILTVIDGAVHNGVAEIADGGICGDGEILQFLRGFGQLVFHEVRMDVLNGITEQLAQITILTGDTCGFRAVGAADLLHPAQDHVGVLHEVAVHSQPVFIRSQVYPVRLPVNKSVPFLQEENI